MNIVCQHFNFNNIQKPVLNITNNNNNNSKVTEGMYLMQMMTLVAVFCLNKGVCICQRDYLMCR